MKLSELIPQLQGILAEHGDMTALQYYDETGKHYELEGRDFTVHTCEHQGDDATRALKLGDKFLQVIDG